MRLSDVSNVLAAAGVGVAGQSTIGGLSGSHTDIPRWCGKPYMAGSPNFDPGGMLEPPAAKPSDMLYVQIQPRHSIYISSEGIGELLVDAILSSTHGSPYVNDSDDGQPFDALYFDIRLQNSDELLISSSVSVNSTNNLFEFDLSLLDPRLTPFDVVLYGSPLQQQKSQQAFTATTELYYLPAKSNGSTVKIDNLNGGILVANNATDYAFKPLLPFGFYTSCSGYLNYSLANVSAYKDLGFNSINPVCAFTDGDLSYPFDWMDEIDLWYQYDMRGSYLNLSSVSEQIPLVKDRSNLLSWYTADEPDGWQYALNSTRLAYDLLKREDPYHPTGLVLNCYNYYFDEYAAGADYIMEDAYPVGINATYSRPWNTTCNETYGDCGCDDCVGELQDVSNRLDGLFDYQQWLGEFEKPLWSVLQAFSGEGYWARDPTAEETWVMMLLSFNHGAKAIMSWTFPTSDVLEQAHGTMSRVASTSPVSDFLLDGQPTRISIPDCDSLDVAYWIHGSQVLISLANLDHESRNDTVAIHIPATVSSVESQPWGSLSWAVCEDGILSVSDLQRLTTSLLIVNCN